MLQLENKEKDPWSLSYFKNHITKSLGDTKTIFFVLLLVSLIMNGSVILFEKISITFAQWRRLLLVVLCYI